MNVLDFPSQFGSNGKIWKFMKHKQSFNQYRELGAFFKVLTGLGYAKKLQTCVLRDLDKSGARFTLPNIGTRDFVVFDKLNVLESTFEYVMFVPDSPITQ